MQRILITGVRGKTGDPLARLLLEQPDVEVLGGSIDPTRVDLPRVQPVLFSWSDAGTWPAAVRDVDALFVVRPDREDAPELITDLLALTSPRGHVVLLSEFDRAYFADDDWMPRVERAVQDSGRTWTVLRPGWFMQVFTDTRFWRDEIVEHGRLPFPGGGQSVSWIDARDIAAVAAHALLETGHESETYDLSGPEALTLPHTAAVLSQGTARAVEHVELSMEEALVDLVGFERRNAAGAFDRIRLGRAGGVSDTVEQVTGRPARSLHEFVHGHRLRAAPPAPPDR